MTKDEVRTVVLDALISVVPEVDIAVLDPDDDLRAQLVVDSVDFLNFMIAVDEALGIEVPEADYGQVSPLSATGSAPGGR